MTNIINFDNSSNPCYRSSYIIIAIFLASIALFRIIATYNIFNHTYDEPVDIVCGMEWLDRGTFLYGSDHPPLARIATALGPFLAGVRLSETELRLLNKIESKETEWNWRYSWDAGKKILHSNDRYFYNLSLARLGIIPFFLVLIFITWTWSRKLFRDITALITLFFIVTIPSILGHAGLATTDVAVTSLCLSGLYAFVLWVETPNYRRCLIFGLTWGLAAIAKFSALLFLPVSAISVMLWCMLFAKRNRLRLSFQPSTGQIKPMLFTLPVAALVAFVVVWSGYRFSVTSLTTSEDRPHSTIDRILGEKGRLHDFTYLIAESPIFPCKEFFHGIWMQKKHNDEGHKSYLLGEYSTHGWWYFFPTVFLIKTPLSFLFFVVIGSITLALKSIRMRNWQFLVPLISAATIMLSAMPANVNLGIRHVLILYPLLAIIAGHGAAYLLNFDRARIAGRVLFLFFSTWYLISTSFSHPDYIAYFNELAVGSPQKYRADSDIDWGQDLKRLGSELKRRSVNSLALSYFGTANPEKFNLPPFTVLKRKQPTDGWVAISVTELLDVYGPAPHDGFAWLKEYQPVTTVGKSIKLYNIERCK